MKTYKILTAIVAMIILIALILISKKDNNISQNSAESIKGCYVATNEKDLYTLNIQSKDGDKITGTLKFDNYQKDSSSGSFVGSYKDGILLGDYSFYSEGMNSVMQVIFEKYGEDFVRGFGELNADGQKFTNLDNITYDPSSALAVFRKSECGSTNIIFPQGGERLLKGKSYDLKWSGGQDDISIFLIDTSTKSVGLSVSIVDRVYGIKNVGSYKYTIADNLKEGTYEFQIGDSTSEPFEVVSK